jgi:cytochrome b561
MAVHRATMIVPANDQSDSYGAASRLFHWLTMLLVLLLVPIGLVMTTLDPGKFQDTLFVTHESLGLSLLALILVRLLWRAVNPPPLPSRDLSRVEIFASSAVHWLLYLVLLAMPLSGYVMVIAGGDPLTYFGLADAPRLLAKSRALAHVTETTHLTLQYAIYALVLMHAGAALHHHYWRRNDVLARMLPRLRHRTGA